MEQKYRMGNEHGYIMWDISLMLQNKDSFPLCSFSVDKLIDGNHRLYKMRKMGRTYLQVYYLSFEQHSQYIIDFDEKMYWDVVKNWDK